MRLPLAFMTLLWTLSLWSAERVVDLRSATEGGLPKEFKSVLVGFGNEPEWRVIDSADDVPSPVVEQRSRELMNERYPILLLDEVLGDFRATVRFKIVSGTLEKSAGLVFRFQNASNYYVIRADALRNSFRCYKIENGEVKPPIGPERPVTPNEWHTLLVECEGTRILCALNGQEVVKLIDSNTRKTGRIGFWTKSDTVAQFSGLKMSYTPHEPLAKALVRDALREFPRVIDLALYSRRNPSEAPFLVAGKDPAAAGRQGTEAEKEVLESGKVVFGRDRDSATVILPLRDRNGDPIAAVRVQIKTFPGQTEDNAIARVRPILSLIQGRAQSLDELLD